ncbi:hypothetical protein ACH4UT_32465 [Streptomyces sp. NPDC020799]|uniref:hypothetical protein n=1 Tax=unclassified Streptomyces TaxID=2593676 RepID=UPI0034070B11
MSALRAVRDDAAGEPERGSSRMRAVGLFRGWTERHLFYLVAQARSGAREVLRHVADQDGEASFDHVRAHFAQHPVHPIAAGRLRGTMTSIDAVRRQITPTAYKPLGHDPERRAYLPDPRTREGLRHALAEASEHPALLRE